MPTPDTPQSGQLQPWSLHAWYVAAMSEELGTTPLARTICGQRVVFFRDRNGHPVALDDFCPHRGAPLSLGFVRDGELVCGYHGLVMGCTGMVSGMPGQTVEKFAGARRFAVVERGSFIWIWPGSAESADLDQLHPLAWADSPQWAYGGGYYHVASDYRLMIDNLMDLTHETYVHGSSIGQKEIDEAPVETRVVGERVITRRFMNGVEAPPFWKMALRGAGLPDDQPVDRWQICHFHLPSHVMIEVGVALAGRGGYDAPDEVRVYATVVDFITPESATSHHYFWGMARRFAVGDAALTDSIREGQRRIFGEDLEMLERQQQNLSSHPDRRLMKLNIDAGGVRSRLLIDRAIARERDTLHQLV
ncbi:aromatic ring-hydroxylating dioxygenase subunit alpha [Novosphingobium olei]|uniref:aromatic ring-hydroxylating dioxygenase subunit alpha n=1 Tax=Novosphingobium olei TaxID=2728851 RepID=UPI003093B78B|nr:aromatic ring-hydroxylating dioxygenase subunit alpha [Novosphingobium olei]